jgi:hypothetical protein
MRDAPARQLHAAPTVGYRLEHVLNHPWLRTDPSSEPPAWEVLNRLTFGLGCWRIFASDVAADYQAQQAGHQRNAFLWASDRAFAARVMRWTLYTLQEIWWRQRPDFRAAAHRVNQGGADDDDRAIVETRPARPTSQKPTWDDSPVGWPAVVICDDRVARFYAGRHAAFAEKQRERERGVPR